MTLSPILFLFFGADLLDTLNRGRILATGFVDDTSLITQGKTTAETTRALTEAHQGCMEWAGRHGAKFSPEKYKLIHFTRRPKRHNMTATVDIDGFTEGPVERLRVLGVQLDTKLRWKAQLEDTI